MENDGHTQRRIQIESLLLSNDISHLVALVGVRGYFLDSKGIPGKNDRAIYDDALFLCSIDRFEFFLGNTDPQTEGGTTPSLKPGIWMYRLGIHGLSKPENQQYEALVQAFPVTVVRDYGVEETGYFGINIHCGGLTKTGSLGCQTIHPTVWPDFIDAVKYEMKKHKQGVIPYLLVEEERLREGKTDAAIETI